ncbi:MAG: zinc-dependent metalloprotease [Nocardioides sp.]|uniref:zinc-dependent metalloprotease n=1 Tax=Nocardioides sp. TaxID=35761 RepID=UPI0039E49857
MSNDPADPSDESGPADQNPFRGTPFEQFFSGSGMPDLTILFSQMQSLMQPHDGPINWDLAIDTSRKLVAQQPDPSPTQRQKDAIADAVQLADHWLDGATGFPSGVQTTAAWSRAEWIVNTQQVWKVLVDPVVGHLVSAMGNALPAEAQSMAGPLLGMLEKVTDLMVATQVGQALGGLAGEVLSASDIGLPLGPTGQAALLSTNITTWAEGMDLEQSDVLLYLALREAAHQRLFAHVPWLRDHLIGAVADYAGGIEIDVTGLEDQMRGLDLNNPAALQDAMQGGLFEPKPTPAQQAALSRLEVTLALVEGWVDEVVGQATEGRMPTATRLQETIRRRRAAGGPAEETFAALVGLELRPRRLRDASTLWGSLRSRQGAEARDGVWMHPDLLPSADDLDDPLGFREGASAPATMTAEEFDAELQNLLDGGLGSDDDA